MIDPNKKKFLDSAKKIRDCIAAFEKRIVFINERFGDTANGYVKAELGAMKYAITLMEQERIKAIAKAHGPAKGIPDQEIDCE